MAKGSKKSRKKSKGWHIPMAIAAPAVLDGMMIVNTAKGGFTQAETQNLAFYFTGWNGTGVDMGRVVNTYGKYAVGAGISVLASKTGVNRRLYKLTRGYIGL